MGRVRRIGIFGPLIGACLLAACGDGIDERSTGDAPTEVTATTTTAPLPAKLAPEMLDIRRRYTNATYSGAHRAVELPGGGYLLVGFDNSSDLGQPERGAVWRSPDLINWTRTGRDISDRPNQQSITDLVVVGEAVVAVGVDYSRNGSSSLASRDAVAWLSDDLGEHFRKVEIERNAGIWGVTVVGEQLIAFGDQELSDDTSSGRLWFSSDGGETWTGSTPLAAVTPGEPAVALVTVHQLLAVGDDLVLVGDSAATDPAQGDSTYPAFDSTAFPWAPMDIALWWSSDGGVTWRAAAPRGLAGLEWAQIAVDAVVAGDRLVVLGGSGAPREGDSWTPQAWVCDIVLQHCTVLAVSSANGEFADGVLVADGNLVYGSSRSFSYDSNSQHDLVFTIDPVSVQVRKGSIPGEIQQIEALLVVDGRLILFGNGTRDNKIAVAAADLT